MAEAVLTFSVSRTKISSATGHNYVTVKFKSDIPYIAFQCRATKVGEAWGVGLGELVAAFSQTPANTERSFDVYNTYLVKGDGKYRISLLAQNESGEWNISPSVIAEFEFPFETSRDGAGIIFGAIQPD